MSSHAPRRDQDRVIPRLACSTPAPSRLPQEKSDSIVVFRADRFHVGCKTAIALRDAGFDARHMKGGPSAWKAIGAPIGLHT